MADAGIPCPMREFILDLMGDNHGGVVCPAYSFTSFKDVISDLLQMIDNQDVLLHSSTSDRWKSFMVDYMEGILK